MTAEQEIEAIRETLIRNCYEGDFRSTAKRSTLSLLYGTLGHLQPQKPEPGRSGVVFGWDVPPSDSTEVDPRLQGLEQKPAPLPHEFQRRDLRDEIRCAHCKRAPTDTNRTETCPARNEPPAEKAEALPELPPRVWTRIHEMVRDDEDEGPMGEVCRVLLAECRKIVREEIGKIRMIYDRDSSGPIYHLVVPGKEGE